AVEPRSPTGSFCPPAHSPRQCAMKFLPLLWSNLQRKRLRTWLTLASIVAAFLLFGILQTMKAALTGGAELAGADRLITMNKVTFIQPLPESHLTRVRGIE